MMMQRKQYDTIVVGGGFFGASIAVHLAGRGEKVALLERENALLTRASFANQARVHQGYHYPRSILTALRSRVNFPRFVSDFESAIDSSFTKYYACASRLSNVSGAQFRLLCERIGAPVKAAPARVTRLFNRELIDAVFEVVEYAFDAKELARLMTERLDEAGVAVLLSTDARTVAAGGARNLTVTVRNDREEDAIGGNRVLLCTYSAMNEILADSNLPLIALRHELAEIALVEPPDELRELGITVMCGPFFSLMPFPARKLHSFSHVRYTPHAAWSDTSAAAAEQRHVLERSKLESAFDRMRRDAMRYMPAVENVRHVDSLWEIKTTLPLSDRDDSRPILFRAGHGLPNLFCILGGKIDNVYDAIHELDAASN